jgi:hypothetical protein
MQETALKSADKMSDKISCAFQFINQTLDDD